MRLVPGGTSRNRRFTLIGAVALTCVLAVAPALAQGWPWNSWGSQPQQQRPPEPREPVYRGPSGGYMPPQAQGGRSAICLQLEQRLAQEANRGSQSRDLLPRLEQDLRVADRQYQMAQSQLERADCYEYFLFSKSLRRTRRCVDLNAQAESAGRRLSELNAQRQQLVSSDSRSYQDDIIRELARNNCGASYQQQARQSNNPFSSFWQDEDSGSSWGGQYGNLPFATFRTVCVRLCDGYYFPVSYSTLPNHFDRDAQACESQCAAPAELFYHQNPGADMAQAVSHRTRQPYNSLKAAFRYRKEFVQGCSCKQAEYAPDATHSDRRAEAPAPATAASRQ